MQKKSSGSVKVFYPRYRRDELIAHLRARTETLAAVLPVTRVTLFGSQATGRATAFSDIDILVVYRGAPRRDAYQLVRKTFDVIGLEPHVYSEQEAERIRPTLERMVRGGVDLLARERQDIE